MAKTECSCGPCNLSAWMKSFGTCLAAVAFVALIKRLFGLGLYGYDIISNFHRIRYHGYK